MQTLFLRPVIGALLTLALAFPALAETLRPFTATYQASSSGLPCGKGKLTLTQLGPDHYRYDASGKICVLGRGLSHSSEFLYRDGKIQPLHYQSKLKGLFSTRNLAGSFDDSQRFTVSLNDEELPDSDEFPRAQWEPTLLVYLLGQARQSEQLSYTWGEETRDYLFEHKGTDILETDLGELPAHLMVQDHLHKDRVARFWFSPELNGLLVKAKISRLGVPWLHIEINEVFWHDEETTP
ncbi:DUF3108 domain-containing protein [Ferrimonas marina]|uniref:DUF3108 domain-containing protein n=1 Tax=Ferrimonas marina TaxID=299255 RepID=A0A1M5RQY5_9GAMM|nr:DUF3108 domain-containing protein [Ferrimonas marina]SHH28283.1 Protein of unknown function [Ferrimonas marina]